MPKRQLHSPRPSAFTLVELLVVISVVAILLSMLLPSMKKARDTALVVTCGSNLRGIGVLVQSYATDYKQYPTPHGQPYIPDPMLPNDDWSQVPNNSPVDDLVFGSMDVAWVGQLDRQGAWPTSKAFYCTATHPFANKGFAQNSYVGATWHQRYGPFTGQNMLASKINGVTYTAPDITKPYYNYCGPYALSRNYVIPGDDYGEQNYDYTHLTFFDGDPNMAAKYQTYPTAPEGVSATFWGPRVNDSDRRAQFACPGASFDPDGISFESYYTPHGEQAYTGTRSYRIKTSEAKNYLFTDGAVQYIYRP